MIFGWGKSTEILGIIGDRITLLWGIFKIHSRILQNYPKLLKYPLCLGNVFYALQILFYDGCK